MKKSLYTVLFSLALSLVVAPQAFADALMPNTRIVDRCVKVVNLVDVPEVALIGRIKQIGGGADKIYEIQNDTCISKGYKFNSLSLYWNDKSKPTTIDENKMVYLVGENGNLFPSKEINLYGGEVENDNPLVRQEIEYRIGTDTKTGKKVLFQSKLLLGYNDGRATTTETVKVPANVSEPAIGHWIDRCVKVVNLVDVPENITLVGYEYISASAGVRKFEIKNDQCFNIGNKTNKLAIYWSTKDKPDTINKDRLILKYVDPDKYVAANNPLVKEELEYRIGINKKVPAKNPVGLFVLYPAKQILAYNDGRPTTTETFKAPANAPEPTIGRWIDRCVKVVNLVDVPDITLVGYEYISASAGVRKFEIKNDQCFKINDKTNKLAIYWNTKDKPTTIEADKLIAEYIDPDKYVVANDPLTREELEYRVGTDTKTGKKVLFKSKYRTWYNDGRAPQIERYQTPVNVSEPAIRSSLGAWLGMLKTFQNWLFDM